MLKIYGVPVSVHTRKVIVAAIAKGLDFEIVPVVPVLADRLSPDWRTLSPTGLIPVLVDGDFVLADSAAICAYLEKLRPTPALYPAQAQEFARALSLEQYAGALFREIVRPLFHEAFVQPNVHRKAPDQAVIEAVFARAVPEMFGYVDSLAGTGFLAGHAWSVADIAVASNLITFRYAGFELDRERFPRLAALFDRTVRQPAMREVLQRERPVAASMGLRADFAGAAS